MLYVGEKTSNAGRRTNGDEGEQQIVCPRIKRKKKRIKTKPETKDTLYHLQVNQYRSLAIVMKTLMAWIHATISFIMFNEFDVT